jgi:hypothetical protein
VLDSSLRYSIDKTTRVLFLPCPPAMRATFVDGGSVLASARC